MNNDSILCVHLSWVPLSGLKSRRLLLKRGRGGRWKSLNSISVDLPSSFRSKYSLLIQPLRGSALSEKETDYPGRGGGAGGGGGGQRDSCNPTNIKMKS